ncbi:MAG: threonylcarbamoyl-AMP synthase [Candidatus Kerfeldbacteria bacterium]|nr:threonylcarbamoyl-AMP synthase [Candidatus Kerfeldbacteria bacterium]
MITRKAKNKILKGDLVAYPTESFYALGVDATNKKATQRLFRTKHREKGKPIALIASDLAQVQRYFHTSPEELKLMKKYWPGSLTIVLRPKKKIAAKVLAPTTPQPLLREEGAARIGVRVPNHTSARRLAARAGAPITATSANISGQPPTKLARVIKQTFPDILIMPGRCGQQRKPSTVVQIIKHKLIIHRQGAAHVHPLAA